MTTGAEAVGGRAAPYAPGDVIGDYRIDCLLGRGGMGFVYGAVNTIIGKRAALKVLGRHVAAPDMIERFITEARAVNQIGHPNIVDIFGFGTTDAGDPYMVMEWLHGESLVERMTRPMAIDEICALLTTIIDALTAAHAKGIVHRDLKPDNVFLHDAGRGATVKLLDFGIAKLLGSDDARAERTRTGYLMGTPAYMSPEQARGKDVDHRSDVYSLGVIAFELFTGAQPFEHETPMDLVVAHLHEVPRAPSAVSAVVPDGVDRLVLAMLDKSPAARPTLGQVRAALAAIADGRGATATMPPRTPPQSFAAAATSVLAAAAPSPPRTTSTIGLASGQTLAPARRGWPWSAAVIAALAVVALAVIAVARRGGAARPAAAPAAIPAPAVDVAPSAPPVAPVEGPAPVAAPAASTETAVAAPPLSPPPVASRPSATAHPSRVGASPSPSPSPSLSQSPSPDAAPAVPPPAIAPAIVAPPAVAPAPTVDAGPSPRPSPVPPTGADDRDGTVDPFAHP